MGKSEGEVLPCHECGSRMVKYEYGVYDVYECKNNACGMIGKFRDLRYHNKPIHPNRLQAEGLVPAAALEELVKALEDLTGWCRGYDKALLMQTGGLGIVQTAESALAHAREIAKGGK